MMKKRFQITTERVLVCSTPREQGSGSVRAENKSRRETPAIEEKNSQAAQFSRSSEKKPAGDRTGEPWSIEGGQNRKNISWRVEEKKNEIGSTSVPKDVKTNEDG